MAMIICPECGAQISDKAAACVKCGCPVITCSECNALVSDNAEACAECGCPIKKAASTQNVAGQQGKAIFQATGDSIALLAKYVIMDNTGKTLEKIRSGGYFEIKIDEDTEFYLKLTGYFGKPTQVIARANKISRYTLGLNGSGMRLRVESN